MKTGRGTLLLLLLLAAAAAVYTGLEVRSTRASRIAESHQTRNLYLITASGLRADHLSSYLYQHSQTPAIDFLAYDGVLFWNAFSSSPESFSAHLSILTGLHPFRRSIRENLDYWFEMTKAKSPNPPDAMPQWFRQRGYRTAAILSDPELRYPSFFRNWFEEVATGDLPMSPWQDGYSTANASRLAQNWVQQHRSQPQFLFLNFSEPTLPFEPPLPYNKHYANHPYDGEVAALDEQVGLFIHLLKTTGLFQNSIVVFTAPYSESLDGVIHSGSVRDPILHVPLLIAAPGILPRHKEYKNQVSLTDIFPTILRLLESQPASRLDGTALFEKGTDQEIPNQTVFAESRIPHVFGLPSQYFVKGSDGQFVREEVSSEKASSLQKRLQAVLDSENLPLPAPATNNLDFEPGALLENAIVLARRGEPAKALDLFESFRDELPHSPFLLSLQAELSLASGDPQKALSFYQEAYALSQSQLMLPRLAAVQLALNHNQEALELEESNRKTTSPSYYDYSTIGITLFRVEKFGEALAELNRSLRENPRYAEAHATRGMVYARLARWSEAESDLNTAMELNPKDYAVMLELARLRLKRGNWKEAVKLCEQVILYAPDQQMKVEAKKLLAQ